MASDARQQRGAQDDRHSHHSRHSQAVGGAVTFRGQRIDDVETAKIARRGIAVVPEGRRVRHMSAVTDDLLPDAISTDIHVLNVDGPVSDLMNHDDEVPRTRRRSCRTHPPGDRRAGGNPAAARPRNARARRRRRCHLFVIVDGNFALTDCLDTSIAAPGGSHRGARLWATHGATAEAEVVVPVPGKWNFPKHATSGT